MSGLALVAARLGAVVTGSDRSAASPYARRLQDAGIAVSEGHEERHVPDGAELVVSTAIPADNPERVAGRRKALRELHRAELLGELTRLKPTVAVSGTHGKTTTSSMVVDPLRGCGLSTSYVVAIEVGSTGTNAATEESEWLVVESDESDRSLLSLSPRVAVLTNAALNHDTT